MVLATIMQMVDSTLSAQRLCGWLGPAVFMALRLTKLVATVTIGLVRSTIAIAHTTPISILVVSIPRVVAVDIAVILYAV